MKRIALILLPTLVAGFLDCRRPEAATQQPLAVLPNTSPGVASDSSAPKWIDNPPPFSGVGFEAPNPMGDLSFQRTFAVAHARTTLARDMDLRVKAVLQELGQTSHAVSEKLSSQSGQGVKEDISRQLTDATISGTQARSFYTDRKGNLWVLVVADPALAQSAVRSLARKELVELGLGQADLQEALGRMDDVLDRSQKAPR